MVVGCGSISYKSCIHYPQPVGSLMLYKGAAPLQRTLSNSNWKIQFGSMLTNYYYEFPADIFSSTVSYSSSKHEKFNLSEKEAMWLQSMTKILFETKQNVVGNLKESKLQSRKQTMTHAPYSSFLHVQTVR